MDLKQIPLGKEMCHEYINNKYQQFGLVLIEFKY